MDEESKQSAPSSRPILKYKKDRGTQHSREELSQRQQLLLNYYFKGIPPTEAMRKAGYSPSMCVSGVQATFGTAKMKEEIEKRRKRMAARNEVTEDWIIQRLMNIADTAIGDLIEVDEEGKPSLNFSKMTPQMKKALAGFDVEQFVQGRGENAKPATKIKVRMADQLRALEMLGKYLGMFRDKVEISGDSDIVNRLLRAKKRVNGVGDDSGNEENERDDDGGDDS